MAKLISQQDSKMEAGLGQVRTDIAVLRDLMLQRFDAMAAKFDESRYDWAKHQLRLDDHESRLSRLEAKSKRH